MSQSKNKIKPFLKRVVIWLLIGCVVLAGGIAVYKWHHTSKLIRECPVAWEEGMGMPTFGIDLNEPEAKKNFSVMTMSDGRKVNDVYNRVNVNWVRQNCSITNPTQRPV